MNSVEVLKKIRREDCCFQLPAVSQDEANIKRKIAWEERQRAYDDALLWKTKLDKLKEWLDKMVALAEYDIKEYARNREDEDGLIMTARFETLKEVVGMLKQNE